MIIQSLWIGDRLSVMEKLSIQSFIACGHVFELYTYQPVAGLPAGTVLRDANEILPLDLDSFRYYDIPSAPAFANVFRYKLLYEKGGVWVDTDVVCLNLTDLPDQYYFPLTSGLIVRGRNREFSVDNWFLKVPQGCELIRYCYEAALRRAGTYMEWGTIGPTLLTSAVQKYALHRFARGPLFFPINYTKFKLLVDPSLEARLIWNMFKNHSIAIHLYRATWNFNHLEIGATYPANSIYEILKSRYLNQPPADAAPQ